jgi:S-adenosylmethionine:tRNA ribosyltransferase-isomerase
MDAKTRTSDFDYSLDPDLIAQKPLRQRDQSRLMVLQRRTTRIEHRRFFELPRLLRKGDLLVLNDTRVIPGKFESRRKTGAKIEGLFLRELHVGRWEVLLKNAQRCKPSEKLQLLEGAKTHLELLENVGQGQWVVDVTPPAPAADILDRTGLTPLPPYIRRANHTEDHADRQRYQTVYAATPGAVAAPTAGLHFSRSLLRKIREAGIKTTCVTLHVGLGTFAPVKTENLSKHKMHSEWYELPREAAAELNAARSENRRIVAVGTTAVRVLEGVARCGGEFRPTTGWTDLFLYPPAEFRAVDALITNFHLPRSTLLMLVAAFSRPGQTDGIKVILDAYAEAARLRYRFYSYGDAMLIE